MNILNTIVLCSTVCTGQIAIAQNKPNIILFLVDDMGWQDTSLPFWTERTPLNEKYHTANMERLAASGMMFTQAYACSVCSPTRVSLMTGMNAARHRVTNWTLYKNQSTDAPDNVLSFPDWNVNGLSPIAGIERTTYVTPLPQLLKDNGYYTIHCGKAHFGAIETPAANPINMGFDVNIGGHAAGGPGSYLGIQNFSAEFRHGGKEWDVPCLEKYHGKDIFLTEALTQEACLALDKARGTKKPFFLYMSHYAVHVPYSADKRFYQKYIDRGFPEVEAEYATIVEGMDKSLGDLMDYLEKNKLTDNTIIIFMSDNGGLAASGRAGQLHVQNAPLNSGKGSAYEGGIREPMIVKWPGKIKPKTKCNDYLIIEDFFPSILEMAQVKKYRTVQQIDGISFVPHLLGTSMPTKSSRDLFWHYPNKWGPTGPGIGATSTIRSGNWKLIYFYEDQHLELYNISEDIGELQNMINQKPEKVKELGKKLGKYLRGVDAQRPSFKETGVLVAWPDESPEILKN